MTTVTYSAVGSVRGSCGHAHRTVGAAALCRARDQRACRRHGGYSDRDVERSDSRELTEDEQDVVYALRARS